jgi:hypothetical protein
MRNSIYLGWRNLPADIHLQDVTVTGGPGWSQRKAPGQSSRQRRAQPVNKLLPLTVDWILALPPPVRPHLLAARFPRIANDICCSWHDPALCQAYFEDLMTDRRGGRQGFPVGILKELHRLWRHYASLHPGIDERR